MMTTLLLMACTEDKVPRDPSSPEPQAPEPTIPTTPEVEPPENECGLDMPLGGPAPVQELCSFDLPSPGFGPSVSASVGPLRPGEMPVLLSGNDSYQGMEVLSLDGQQRFSLPVFSRGMSLLLDAEGDGESEIYVMEDVDTATRSREVERWSADGALVWVSPRLYSLGWSFSSVDGMPTAGDLDGDGIAELVFGEWVLDPATGELLHQLEVGPGGAETDGPVLADLDGDGSTEILYGSRVYDASYTLLWSVDIEQSLSSPLALDLDGDPDLEVVIAGPGEVRAYEPDGELIWTVGPVPKSVLMPPCVADFDGDGELELAAVLGLKLKVLERDGSLLWEKEDSWPAACSAADLDGDGAAELLFTETLGFGILDGPTGSTRFYDGGISGRTPPVIVDIDGDSKAEVIVSSADWYVGGGIEGYRVYDSPAWPGVGPQWSMSDFSDERLTPTGLVTPRSTGLFNARTPTSPGQPGPTALLQVELHDSCTVSCEPDGEVQVSAIVRNVGAAEAPAGVMLQIFSRQDGEVTLVGEQALPAVPEGTVLDAVVVELEPVAGQGELFAALTDYQCLPSRPIPEPCE